MTGHSNGVVKVANADISAMTSYRLEILPLLGGPGHYGIDVPDGSYFVGVSTLTVPIQTAIIKPGAKDGEMTAVPVLVARISDKPEKKRISIHVAVAGEPLSADAGLMVGSTSLGTIVVAVFLGISPIPAPESATKEP